VTLNYDTKSRVTSISDGIATYVTKEFEHFRAFLLALWAEKAKQKSAKAPRDENEDDDWCGAYEGL
jgi:hypothetical protein